jgi:hypothetical protein
MNTPASQQDLVNRKKQIESKSSKVESQHKCSFHEKLSYFFMNAPASQQDLVNKLFLLSFAFE